MNWFHSNFDLDVEILFKIRYSDFLGNFNRHWTLPLFYWLLCTLVHILYWIKRQKYVIYRCWKPLLWVVTFAVSLYFSKGVIHFLWFGLCSSSVMLCKQTSAKLSGLKQTTFCLWIYNLVRSWRGSLSLIHLMSALAEAWIIWKLTTGTSGRRHMKTDGVWNTWSPMAISHYFWVISPKS